MRNILFFLVFIAGLFVSNGQELNCLVTINSDKISGSNKQVFNTLQRSLTEFVNQTQWTNKNFKPQEKVTCAFTITINKQPNPNRFEATLQVQAARPVYNTSYSTPILNINDANFNFKYNEFQPLNYNETVFESNLISTIVYYVYVILGVDADTFQLNGGDAYYKKAKEVLLLAQQNGGEGWIDEVGKQNRYSLIDNLTSEKLKGFKNVLYTYHRKGLDELATNTNTAKNNISSTLILLESLHNKVIGNHILRFFFDAKSDEIIQLFSDGPRVANTQKLQNVLERISPTNRNKWRKIK
ncbi:MAG: DUF4835 family protein [Flavobacteriaceae bacterium]|nr:DUF4835 family protein [Flavobacteriaceae bacterium]